MQTSHIYAQPYHHESAYIVGNPEFMKQLADAALDLSATTLPQIRSLRCVPSDGEAFDLEVVCLPDGSQYWDNLKLPYTDYEFSSQGIDPNRLAIELVKQGAGEPSSDAAMVKLRESILEPSPLLSSSSPEMAKLKELTNSWQTDLQEAVTLTIANDPEDYEQIKSALEGLKLILEIKKLTGC